MNTDSMAIVKGHYEVRRKMSVQLKALMAICAEYRHIIEEMDKEIRRLRNGS